MRLRGRPPVVVAALAILVLEVLATIVAIAVNLPTQFDYVGVDAADEFVSRGTAISAPVLPLVVLAGAALLASRRDRWGSAAVVVIGVLGILFVIGALGEAFAEGTGDVSKAVLVGSGVVGTAVGIALTCLSLAELVGRRRGRVTIGHG